LGLPLELLRSLRRPHRRQRGGRVHLHGPLPRRHLVDLQDRLPAEELKRDLFICNHPKLRSPPRKRGSSMESLGVSALFWIPAYAGMSGVWLDPDENSDRPNLVTSPDPTHYPASAS